MDCKIFIVSLFFLSIEGQYFTKIPCKTELSCKSAVNPENEYKCVNGICMCKNTTSKSYIYCSVEDVILSTKKKGLKRNCTTDEECDHINGAKCYKEGADKSAKICDCQPEMVMSSNEQSCLPIVSQLSNECTDSVQCTAGLEGAECHAGKCRCLSSFHYVPLSKHCVANKAYGEYCTREEESCYQLVEPHGTNVLECSNGNICKCLRNYVHVNGLCQYSDASRTVVEIFFVIVLVIVTIKLY